jgi:hypothetical protein
MNDHSRSAAREGFAHQRAHLVFATNRKLPVPPRKAAGTPTAGQSSARRNIVRDGLIGFVSAHPQ